MTYHLVLSGAFLLPKSIIGCKRQMDCAVASVHSYFHSKMESQAGRSGKQSVAAMLTCCGCSLLCTRTRASHNFCRPCQEGPDAANRCRHCQEPWHTHTHTAQQHQCWHTEGHADSQSRNDLINCGYNSALAHLKKGKHNWRVENANMCSTLRANTNEY